MDDEYDPYAERAKILEKPLKAWEAFIHVFKGCFGTGILALPAAFSDAGYGNGFIFTALISVISFYAIHIIVSDMYVLCKLVRQPHLQYPEAMEEAIKLGPKCFRWAAKTSSYVTRFSLALKHFLTCAFYAYFTATTIKEIVDQYTAPIDHRFYVAALFIPFVLLFLVRYLKTMTLISLIGTILVFIGYSCVLYYFFKDLPPFEDRYSFKSFEFLPTFYGTVLFAATSVGPMLAIEGEMKNPKLFTSLFGVLNISALVVVLYYCFFAFFGYWQYGEEVNDTVIRNLPENWISNLILLLFAFAIFFSYALQGYVSHNIIWLYWIKPRFRKELGGYWELCFRFLFVVCTVVVAVTVKYLGAIMSLSGALCVSFLLLVFPGVMDLCLKYQTGYGKIYQYFIRDVILIILGLLGAVSGMYFSILHIIEKVRRGDNF